MSAFYRPALPEFVPWNDHRRYPADEMILRSREFEMAVKRRIRMATEKEEWEFPELCNTLDE